MSAEFGDYAGGYMHWKIGGAAEDCLDRGCYGITQRLGKLLEPLALMAREISLAEAQDTCEETACQDVIPYLPEIRAALDDLEAYCQGSERDEPIRRRID